MQQKEPSTFGKITAFKESVGGENIIHAPMVPPPQTIPDHTKPPVSRKMKPKTLSTSVTRGNL